MKNRSNILSHSFFALLVIAPFAAGIIYALLYSFGFIGELNQEFTLQHWKNVLQSAEIFKSFFFSIYIGITSLLISVSIAFLFVMKRKINSSGWMSYFFYLPLAIPAMVAAFFTFQFLSGAGFLSRIFFQLHISNGIDDFPDLVNDTFGIGIIITHVMLALPFFILLFRNYYQSEKLETLKELSLTLGSTSSQFNLKILIPVLLNKTFAPLALYFIFILGSYEIPLLLGQQSPQMISVLVNRKLSRYNLLDIPQGYVIAILYTLLVMLLLYFFIKSKDKSHVQQA
ncbi:MAG: ABC transporter permease subunit [Chitinophagales bacterium]|nr:ABC transporter permease subunit [Chitinophagales bacterium]